MGTHRSYRQRNYAFSKQVVQLRTRLLLTQRQLAEQIGVHWHSVQKWETGESYPKAETLQRLIAVYLRHQAFTVGQELEEAQALWRQVSEDGPRRLAPFDDAWFAHLLAERASTPAPARAPVTPIAPASVLDRVLPEGLVTFLASDIEGSTMRWEHAPQAMQQALTRHHAIFHQLTQLYDGQVLHTAGDSFICVFADAEAALQSALALQRALLAEPWPEAVAPLLIRMALHSGAATTQGEGYVAEPTLNRLSRVLELSQGGLILLTQATLDLIGARWPEGVTRHDLGVQQLRDVTMPLQLWQALAPDLPATPSGEQGSPRALSSALADRPRSVVDWGEAIAVSTLYGRESELITLQRWVVDEHCRVVTILGLGGIGKSSLAITLAHQVLAQFDVVLFRSLRNGPPLAGVLDQTIGAVSDQQATPPEQLLDKIARLIQLLRERRCLLILDNFEALMQPGAPTGTYRTGYVEYGELIRALSEREHQSCLLLTSREKPAELGLHESRSAPVRTLPLTGLDDRACHRILEARDITATSTTVSALSRLYGGNPLALQLVSEPIHELFGGDVAAFLAMGDAFFNGVGHLLGQQFGRSTPLEQTILYWLAIERELASLSALLANLGEAVPQREVLVALESLRRRMLIERAAEQPAFTLQPVILEFLTDQLVEAVQHELVDGQPQLLCSHALVQATAKEYVRRSQEQLIARPLLERLVGASGDADALERQLLLLLTFWREQPRRAQAYGPGNVINLLRLLRGELRGLDLGRLAIRQAYLAEVDAQDARLVDAELADTVLAEAFHYPVSVALSGDGTLLAAGTSTGQVWLWRIADRTPLWAVEGHTGGVWGMALSADGRLVASGGGDGTVRLWEASSGRALATLSGHTSGVRGVALSGDGQLLASGGEDGTVRLWEAGSGRLLATLSGHTSGVWCVALSADGQLLASGGEDETVRLWEAGSGRALATLSGHTGGVRGVALSSDGQLLASGGLDGMVRLWEASSGRPLATLSGHTGGVWRVALSSDGQLLASGGLDGMVRLWEASSGRALATLSGHTGGVWGVTLSADGQLLASGGGDETVRLWESSSGRLLATLSGHTGGVRGVALSADGQLLASGGDDRTVRLWEASSGRPLATLSGHTGVVWRVALSSDGQLLASGGLDGTVRLWEASSGRSLATLSGHTGGVRGVALSADGQLLASGGEDGTVRLWEASSGRPLAILSGHTGGLVGVVLSGDGQLVASASLDGTVKLWEARSGTCMRTLRAERRYERMDISGLIGITAAQRASLIALGAVERPLDRRLGHSPSTS